MPQKRYIVRLTAQEREVCQQTLRTLNGGSEKVRRAQILLKADADGPAWTDQQIADAFSCRTKTVENIRQRCVLDGFERALERKQRPSPPVPKLLDGEQESQVIALCLASSTSAAQRQLFLPARTGAPWTTHAGGRTGGPAGVQAVRWALLRVLKKQKTKRSERPLGDVHVVR